MSKLTALACCVGIACALAGAAPAGTDAEPLSITRTQIDAGHVNRLQAAYRAYRAGRSDEARSGYQEVLRAYPDNRDAMLGLAAGALAQGDLRSAAGMYRRLLRAFPQDALSRAALVSLQQQHRGEPVIRELLSRRPGEPFLHLVLGQLHAAQRHWPEARRAFSAAHRIDPANPVYAVNLAISLDRMGRRGEALQYYRATLRLVERGPVAPGGANLDIRPVVRRIQTLKPAYLTK